MHRFFRLFVTPRAAPQGNQSRRCRQSFDLSKLVFRTSFNDDQLTRQYHHSNQKKHPIRIRLISFFYRNFEISNSRIKVDIKNLLATKRSKFCKNVIGFFYVVLAFLNLEFQSDSVFWSKSHVWREMREIGKSSVGVYQVTEYFDIIFEKI